MKYPLPPNRSILEACVEKKTLEELDKMFATFERNISIRADLDDLIERRMLKKTESGNYKTTEEGKEWLGL